MALKQQSFEYTSDGLHLTELQRHFYEYNGYLIIPNLFSNDLLDTWIQRFIDICNKKIVPTKKMVFTKDPGLLRNSEKQGEYLYYKLNDIMEDPVFLKHAACSGIVDIVSSIIGPDITAIHSSVINKPPDSTVDHSRHPMHQDLHFFNFKPENKIVATWTALERADESNGCIYVVPGSHKWKLYPHTYPENVKNKCCHGVHGFDDIPTVNLVMEKGDTVFFHPLLFHGSGPNLTKGFRKSITTHYANSFCEFFDVTGTTQEEFSKEVIEMFARQNVHLSFQEIWKYKSKLIRGRPGSFQNFSSHL